MCPCLQVLQSAGLLKLGIVGYGLYTMRDIHGPRSVRGFAQQRGENIASSYPGTVVWPAPGAVTFSKEMCRLWDLGGRSLRWVGQTVVSGVGEPPMFRANCTAGVHVKGADGVEKEIRPGTTNFSTNANGKAFASKRVGGLTMSKLARCTQLADVTDHELFTSYGAGYLAKLRKSGATASETATASGGSVSPQP